jgi:hypothetical protein
MLRALSCALFRWRGACYNKVAGTLLTNGIPATPIELSWEKVGGFRRWFHAKKPGRSTTDNRGLARSVPALNLGPSLQMVRTRERSPLWTSSSNLNLIAATQDGRNTSSNCIPATPIDAFVGGGYSPTLAGCEQARTLDEAIMRPRS